MWHFAVGNDHASHGNVTIPNASMQKRVGIIAGFYGNIVVIILRTTSG